MKWIFFTAMFLSTLFAQAQTVQNQTVRPQFIPPPGASTFRSSRVEELFIWKISEELQLSVKEEKDVSSLIRDLNQRKSEANEKIDDLIHQQATVDSEASAPRFLKNYRIALSNYNKISLDEVDKIQKILPKSKVAKYFVVKADLSKRIRGLLSLPDRTRTRGFTQGLEIPKTESIPLAEPKLIEEE